jgi:DNA polymerase elongation subunit (family B)
VKILMLDIETSPNLAYCWGLFDQNIPITAVKESSSILCWAAKWKGQKDVMFDSVRESGKKGMLKGIHKLMDEADAICHYNGTRFDIPVLNKEFLLNKMAPPAPSRDIDLLRTARARFKFTSNKLDYVAQALKLGAKTAHPGYQMWVDCMNNDAQAWKLMEKYNRQDVLLLEKVYWALLPWIKNHPNQNLYCGKEVCPACASTHMQRRGTAVSLAVTYQRFQCLDCGKWSRGEKSETHKKAKYVGVH